MAWSDVVYSRFGLGYRIRFEVQCDDGSYVDLNTPTPDTPSDYYDCLLGTPKFAFRSERDGIYAAFPDRVRVRNTPWCGHRYGFWRAPFPVTIRRSGVDRVFRGWLGRKVHVVIETYLSSGTLYASTTLPTFTILDVKAGIGDEATIEMVGLHERLMVTSCDNVRDGANYFQGRPIGFLAHQIVKAADPDLSFDPDVRDGLVSLGTLDTPRASSWGPCPGIQAGGAASAWHGPVRCLGYDYSDATKIPVGIELPGSRPTSDGLVAVFTPSTGRWQVVATPEATQFQGWRPIAVHTGDAVYWYVAAIREKTLADQGGNTGFYEIRFYRIQKSDGAITNMGGGPWTYWPARWSLRLGSLFGSYEMHAGYTYTRAQFSGENLFCPFPQTIDLLQEYLDTLSMTSFYADAQRNGYQCTSKEESGTAIYYDTPFPIKEPAHHGARSVITLGSPNPSVGAFRHWMTDTFHGPCLKGNGIAGGTKHWYWVTFVSGQWWVYRIGLSSPYTQEQWTLPLGGSSSFYDRQVSAYCFNGNNATTTRSVLLATIEWNETVGATPPYSVAKFVKADFNGASGTAAIFTTLWTQTPTTPATSYHICGLHALPANDSDYMQSTYRYVMAVVCHRGDLRSGRTYEVAVWDAQSSAWIAAPGSSTGPRSSKPWSGFTLNHADNRVYFVDQATGQLWSVAAATATTAAAWTMENDSYPMHQAEPHCAAPSGRWMRIDTISRMFWALTPGPHGDVTKPYWQRAAASPASARAIAGNHPLIQFSTRITDCIENARFDGMFGWDVLKAFLELTPGRTIRMDSGDVLRFPVRQAGTSVGTLTLEPYSGYVALESGQIPVLFYEDRIRRDLVVNDVTVIPHGLKRNAAEWTRIVGPGGESAWTPIVEVGTERPLDISLTCVSGGDVVQDQADPLAQKAILWRIARVLETLTCRLTVAAAQDATTVYVSGVIQRNGGFYCGDQRVRVNDFVTVADGTQRTISAMGAYGTTAVILYLSGTIDVTDGAPAFSPVEIVPQDGEAASDFGVTTLSAACDGSQTSIWLVDAGSLQPEMVVLVDLEYMLISEIQTNAIIVERGWLGTTAAAHSLGAVVKGFLATQAPNRTYQVGNTGVRFGVQLDPDAEVEARTVRVGDSILIRSKGYTLEPIEHAKVNRVDQESINFYGRRGISRRAVELDPNRFADPVKAAAIAPAKIQGTPPIGLSGVVMPYIPWLLPGVTVTVSDDRIVPGGVAKTFELVGCEPDLDSGLMTAEFVSYEGISEGMRPGAGAEDVNQQAYKKGRKGRSVPT